MLRLVANESRVGRWWWICGMGREDVVAAGVGRVICDRRAPGALNLGNLSELDALGFIDEVEFRSCLQEP